MLFFPASASAQQAITGGHPDSLGNNALNVSPVHSGTSIDEVSDTNRLLDHCVHYLPMNSNVDVPASFAYYYFLEVLVRYRAQHNGD
jgi:hypothetical protein